MISKNRLKSIRQLAQKKQRDAQKLFVAEGPKVVGDILQKYPCTYLAATRKWLRKGGAKYLNKEFPVEEITEEELHKASFLQSPQEVIGIFRQNVPLPLPPDMTARQLCLALDGIQDPGNLGTILRVADWFGVEHVVCSPDCADVFSPKVVQASMGALGRVNVHYMPLTPFLSQLPPTVPIFGTFLEGDNIYSTPLPANGILLMGNEGHGIRQETAQWVSQRLFIPNFPANRPTSESLNVAIATAIACAEFRRRLHK